MTAARPKRRAIPLRVKLASALIFAGFDPRAAAKAAGIKLPKRDELYGDGPMGRFDPIEFDHDPALELRRAVAQLPRCPWTAKALMPDANDPRHIVPRLKAAHRVKTSADQTAIAKTKRLERKRVWSQPTAGIVAGQIVETNLCEDCPPIGYPTDKTRCEPCPRRRPRAKPKRPWPKGRKMQSRPFPERWKR